MSRKKVFVIALLLVLPGVTLRVAPYTERVFAPAAEPAAPAAHGEAKRASVFDFQSTSSRLSQRPLMLVMAGFAIEVGIYVIAISLLLRSRRFVALIGAVSYRQQVFRIVFFMALIAGFLAGSPESFPFVAWRMYSGMSEKPPTAHLVTGVTRSGAVVRLDLGRLLPMLGPHRGYSLIAERAGATADADTKYDTAELTTALLVVGRLYNLQNGTDPVERLSLSTATIPLDNRAPPWLRDERVIATVEVE